MVYKIHSVRLKPKADLKNSIFKLVTQKNIQAGVILSSVGSLSIAQIRLANSNKSRKLKGPLEVISLNGTVSKNGLHLHISVANSKGALIGGHLLEGCLIYTTCELVILEIKSQFFSRQHDPKTGFRELLISR